MEIKSLCHLWMGKKNCNEFVFGYKIDVDTNDKIKYAYGIMFKDKSDAVAYKLRWL